MARCALPEADNPSVLEAVLEVADSSITYRSRYSLLPQLAAVFDLVLLDDKNPRSVSFSNQPAPPAFRAAAAGTQCRPARAARFSTTAPRGSSKATRANWPALKTDLPDSKVGRVIQQTCATCRKFPTPSPQIFCALAISRTGRARSTMNYRIVHRTLYEYSAPVTVSHNVARLEPRTRRAGARGIHAENFAASRRCARRATDYFGNQLCFFSIQETHQRLEIVTTSRVTVNARKLPAPGIVTRVGGGRKIVPRPGFARSSSRINSSLIRRRVRASVDFRLRARKFFQRNTPLLAGAVDLTRRIFEDFKFDPRATTVATPLEEVLEKRRGVCQDFAHLGHRVPAFARPARALCQRLFAHASAGRSGRARGADASHAWFRIFCPGTGWVDFDPTNNVQPGEEHISGRRLRPRFQRRESGGGNSHRRRRTNGSRWMIFVLRFCRSASSRFLFQRVRSAACARTSRM
jgi:transglutaminase-like putative cysteine protease